MAVFARAGQQTPIEAAFGTPRGFAAATVLLLAIVAATFATALGGDFVYDDFALLAESPALRDPFDVVGLWTRPLWGEQLGHWRPLTAQLLASSMSLGNGEPHFVHALAIAAHLAAVFAVLCIARRAGLPPSVALASALVFAVHPAQAEPVAWCAGLNDVLCGAFLLLALERHLAFREDGARSARWCSIAFAVLAAASKEPGVLAAALLFFADVARRTPIREAAGAFARLGWLPVLWFVARVLVFGEWTAGLARSTYVPPGHPVVNAVGVGFGLTRHLAWPVDLGMFEPPAVSPGSVVTAAALTIVLAMLWRRRVRAARLGAVLVCAAIVPPMLSVGSLGPYPIADRYLYVACAGLALTLGSLFARMQRGAFVLAFAVGLPWLAATTSRIPTWHDQAVFVSKSLTLWPDDPRLHLMQAQLELERAASDPTAALLVDTSLQRARDLLGGDLRSKDHLASVRRDVAVALAWRVAARTERNGQPDWLAAERAFLVLVEDWPACADAFVGLGVARAATGRLELAERDLRHAIELDPGTAPAHHNLARVLYEQGDKAGARDHLREAVRLRPDDQTSRALLDVLAREGFR